MLRARGHCTNKNHVLLLCGLILFFVLLVTFYDHAKTRYIINSTKVKLNSMFSIESDYMCLMNLTFTFRMLPLVCNKSEDSLLILVHSATDHFNNRRVIRETWGQNSDNMKVLFLVGEVEDEAVQKKLEDESSLHEDILQGNFLDTYHNLTYKHVMALKYVVYHCSSVQFVLKVDDDVFVNIPTLKIFLRYYLYEKGKPTKILCSILRNPPVLRAGKWATSLEDFPDANYPTHCGGFAILYPQSVIHSLYAAIQKTKFFWVDDVFITGICAKKLNITHISIENLVLSNDDVHDIVDLSFTNITKPFLIGRIDLNEIQIRSLWNFVINHKPKTMLDYLIYD